jgi:hypothetical protein
MARSRFLTFFGPLCYLKRIFQFDCRLKCPPEPPIVNSPQLTSQSDIPLGITPVGDGIAELIAGSDKECERGTERSGPIQLFGNRQDGGSVSLFERHRETQNRQ